MSHHGCDCSMCEKREELSREFRRQYQVALLGARCLEMFGWIGSLAGTLDEMRRLEGVEREFNRQKQAVQKPMEGSSDSRPDIAYELDRERFKSWQQKEYWEQIPEGY